MLCADVGISYERWMNQIFAIYPTTTKIRPVYGKRIHFPPSMINNTGSNVFFGGKILHKTMMRSIAYQIIWRDTTNLPVSVGTW